MKMIRICLGCALSTLLLICGQIAFADIVPLDFSEEVSDLGVPSDASVYAPVIVVLDNDLGELNKHLLTSTGDVEVTDYGKDGNQLIVAMPVSYRAYDLYRAYKVPFPRSH